MKTLSLYVWLSLMLLLFLTPSAAQAQQPPNTQPIAKYDVIIVRPFKVGQRYRLKTRQEEQARSKVTVADEVKKEQAESSVLEFSAVVRVLAVNAKGMTQRAEFTVERCLRTANNAAPQVLVKPGVTLTGAIAGDQVNFYLNGKPVAEELRDALEDAADFELGEISDDEWSQPDTPKAVGESWALDVPKAVDSFQRAGLSFTPENLKGQIQLNELVTGSPENSLKVIGKIEAKSFTMPVGTEVKLVSSGFEGNFVYRLPVNRAALIPHKEGEFIVRMVMQSATATNASAPLTHNEVTMKFLSQTEPLATTPAPPKRR